MTNVVYNKKEEQEETVFQLFAHVARASVAFVEGLRCAYHGFRLAWNNPTVKSAQKKSAVTVLGSCCIAYICLLLIIIPIRSLLYLLSYSKHANQHVIDYIIDSITPFNLALHLLWFIPLVAMLVLSNVLGYENIFFSVLDSISPRLSAHLFSLPPQPIHARVMRAIKRTSILLLFAIFLQSLRYVPYVGSFIPALWLMKLSYQLIQFHANLAVRLILCVGLLVVAIVPWIQPIAFLALNFHMASLALARELFDPYLTRIIQLNATRGYHPYAIPPVATPVTTAEKLANMNEQYSLVSLLSDTDEKGQTPRTTPEGTESSASTSPTQLVAPDPSDPDSSVTDMKTPLYNTTTSIFLREYYFQLLGFAFPYMLLTSVPFVGLLFSGFSHGAAAWMILYIQHKQHAEQYLKSKNQ